MANQLTSSEQAALEAFIDALATERIDESTAVRYLRVLSLATAFIVLYSQDVET